MGLRGGGKLLLLRSLFIQVPYSNHLWFLKAIFILNLINPIIYAFIHGNDKRIKYLLVILGVCTIKFFDIVVCRFKNPLLHWQDAYSVLYYVLGYAVLTSENTRKVKIWMLAVGIITFALLQWGYNWVLLDGPMSNLNTLKRWVINVVWDGYNAPFIVVLTTLVVMLFQKINWKECRFIQFIGQYSLAIYVMQTPIQRFWEMVLPIKQWMEICHAFGMVLPIVTLLSCMLITKLFLTNKYTRFWIEI